MSIAAINPMPIGTNTLNLQLIGSWANEALGILNLQHPTLNYAAELSELSNIALPSPTSMGAIQPVVTSDDIGKLFATRQLSRNNSQPNTARTSSNASRTISRAAMASQPSAEMSHVTRSSLASSRVPGASNGSSASSLSVRSSEYGEMDVYGLQDPAGDEVP